ncbi:hypothetical protein CVT24_004055 [Panaeolus cyanescens]|uniref:Uncharacterized protein n=1 Tax=Panaeolus cyanescens TaxID=181874 RepID=A0A409Y6B3_9AGAR|nr:hypothetical protein CVT24_004055 [Panaeolus cyanescens]
MLKSTTSTPRHRAQVLDLISEALEALHETRRLQEELESESAIELKRVEKAYSSILLDLTRVPEVKKSDISVFYPPEDGVLLHDYLEDLFSWIQATRTWILKAQRDGVLPDFKKVETKAVAGPQETTEEKVEATPDREDGTGGPLYLDIMKRLVAFHETVEALQVHDRNPRKYIERIRIRKVPTPGEPHMHTSNDLESISSKAVAKVPDTTDSCRKLSEALERAVDAYKACRWQFHLHGVESKLDYSHVFDAQHRQRRVDAVEQPQLSDDWQETVNKAIKQVIEEQKENVSNMIINNAELKNSIAASTSAFESKVWASMEYPLQAIHHFTKKLNTDGQEVEGSNRNSETQFVLKDDGSVLAAEEEDKMVVD